MDGAGVDVGQRTDRQQHGRGEGEDMVLGRQVELGEAAAPPPHTLLEAAAGAEVIVAAPAGLAGAAAPEVHRLNRHAVAHGAAGHARAGLEDDARELVPQPLRPDCGAPGVLPPVVVEVGAADPRRRHLHQHLPVARPRRGHLLDPDVGTAVEDRRLHAPATPPARAGAAACRAGSGGRSDPAGRGGRRRRRRRWRRRAAPSARAS
jgi:hypothetical protein